MLKMLKKLMLINVKFQISILDFNFFHMDPPQSSCQIARKAFKEPLYIFMLSLNDQKFPDLLIIFFRGKSNFCSVSSTVDNISISI